MSILEISNLSKIYEDRKGKVETQALNGLNLSVNKGEFVAIMGESGSGKSTLLNIIATLDKASHGKVLLNNRNLNEIPNKDLASFRRNELGFVFQDFNVLDSFSNKDNILLPLVLSNMSVKEMESRLNQVIPILGIKDLMEKFPYEVSGGQRQRIAIARAIITNPSILLADEPTGALDSKSADNIMNVFEKLNQQGNTILMVTHSLSAASYSNRVTFIKDGRIYHEIYRGQENRLDFQAKIAEAMTMLNSRGGSNV